MRNEISENATLLNLVKMTTYLQRRRTERFLFSGGFPFHAYVLNPELDQPVEELTFKSLTQDMDQMSQRISDQLSPAQIVDVGRGPILEIEQHLSSDEEAADGKTIV